MPVIPRDVLLTHLMLMTSNPCGSVATAVSEHIFVRFVFIGHVLQGGLAVKGHCWRFFWATRKWRMRGIEEIDDSSIDITGCHTELVDLCRDMTRITGHVLLVEGAHLAVSRTQKHFILFIITNKIRLTLN